MKGVVFLGDRKLELTAFSPTTGLFDNRLPLVLGLGVVRCVRETSPV
jgi:hypothetical protein